MLFNQSIGLARQQGALSWELRSVQSLARLWHRTGKRQQALSAIADVRNRFSEGFETVDLVQAQQLIIDLNV
jgi:predicted ATPase